MADLTIENQWPSGIYRLETTDPVLGGASGIANLQPKQLGDRTLWLRKKLEEGSDSGSNLDLLVIGGFYSCSDTVSNTPNGAACLVSVMARSTGVTQMAIEDASYAVYYRSSTDSGGSWGPWERLATASELNDLESSTFNPTTISGNFNTFLTSGTFKITDLAGSSNKPASNEGSTPTTVIFLEVRKSGTHVLQTATAPNETGKTRQWVRISVNSGSTWSAWQLTSTNLIQPSYVYASRNSDQSFVAGVYGTITWENEIDDLGEFNASNSQFTAQEKGIYNINFVYRMDLSNPNGTSAEIQFWDGTNWLPIAYGIRNVISIQGTVAANISYKLEAGQKIRVVVLPFTVNGLLEYAALSITKSNSLV